MRNNERKQLLFDYKYVIKKIAFELARSGNKRVSVSDVLMQMVNK